MNIVTGFACAIGIDMGYNHSHHHDVNEDDEMCHSHSKQVKGHHTEKSSPDDCCKDSVTKISLSAKELPAKISTNYLPYFVLVLPLYGSYILPSINYPYVSQKFFVQGHHPPIAKIILATQSFLI